MTETIEMDNVNQYHNYLVLTICIQLKRFAKMDRGFSRCQTDQCRSMRQ